ncbi:MAG: alcohol dehydrogenase catalytic domain-containing protein [Clostridia bacterium]|nr:alcohol dehydrogenase catalytic domain-containing protein [Clostridia bacterium]MBT7123368.1 alcohol dehydrogenase catalytic domain-containing protein [Clostridia bacterium]
MLAARLYGKRDLRTGEIEVPSINENEVLLKVKSAAVCGTDIRMYKNSYAGIDEAHPRTLCHEFSGVIEKAGNCAQGFGEGMRVSVAPNIGCGICNRCVRGDFHLCNKFTAFGINMDGAFAQYVVVPEKAVRQGNLMEMPKGVTFDDAAINEALSCAYNGFLKCDIKPGESVLVVGAGPIGIMHAKLALMAGAGKVFMNDLSSERLDACRQIDERIITYHGDSLKEFVMDNTDEGLDVCITACPSPEVQQAALGLMDYGGRINFFGGLPKNKENVSINTNIIHYKQLIVTGSTRANIAHFRQTLKFISEGILDVSDLVTAKFELKDIHIAFEMAENAVGLKNVIQM